MRVELVVFGCQWSGCACSCSGSGNDWELGEFTPSFIWLLRDFYLHLEEEGVEVTPRDYLETALRPIGGTGPSVEAKNQIRASIKHLFPDRECFTLVMPQLALPYFLRRGCLHFVFHFFNPRSCWRYVGSPCERREAAAATGDSRLIPVAT
jgi:hypothetical protein